MPNSKPGRDLAVIEEMIRPLDAPVKKFEREIRTTPLRTLISVLLSSRTKDAVTLSASSRLFEGVQDCRDLAGLSVEEIEDRIYPVGFYHQKARQIKGLAQTLASGVPLVPERDRLMALPGVGRKTANLVLALAYSIPAIAVDVHVFRISRRLGWCRGDGPDQVEEELMQLFERRDWPRINQTLVAFGQTICRPLRPLCQECLLKNSCPSSTVG